MANKDVISSNSVTRWGEQPPPEEERLTEALLDDTAATPYPINEELNFKVALWQGDITKLQVDALINCNNEDLNERAGISGQIFVGAGPQLEEACAKLGGCPPGDAKATRGFRLPAKHVIHAVPPAWIDGGEGDAALEALYTKSLDVARRLTCATVGCVPLKTKDVPREQAAHLAICAMRKRLESPEGKGIQLLVIAMRPEDVYDNMIYDNLLPLYFPRSGTEELEAARLLALHNQNNSGGAGAGAAATAPSGPTGGGAAPDFPYQPSAALAAVTQPPHANGAGGVQGKDAAGRAVARGVVAAGGVMPPSGSAYGSFLQRAGLADLSDLEALQLFYRAGVDARGRAVFLFWAGHLPSRPIDLERVLMLIMRTLDPYAHNEYILVYVHTTLAPENEPSFAWLRKVYDLFDARLKDNLYLMFVVHASWWLKMTMNFVRTFVSQRFWDDKLIMLDSFADLFKRNYFAPGSLRMPDSPLVRKYLETSGDAHMLDQLLPGAASARDARTDALAKAVASGALPGGDALPPGAPPASKAAVAMAAAERDGSGPGSAAARQLEQARASKEILLKQLIELSDQLAHAQGDKAAAERKMTATLAAKDGELNRLAQALADAQDKAEGASGRLAEVKNYREQMERQDQQRADILAEMSDLEGQLAQTQVYNDYMAKELHNVMGTLKREKWELLGEMSLLERQLAAAKQRGGAPTGVSAEEEIAELKKAGAAARVDWAKVPEAAKGAMMLELSELATALRAERGAAEAAMGELGQQHADFGRQVQQASDELASIKRAEGQRAAEASARKNEMGAAVKVLEEKIAGVKSAAKRGASALSETRQADAKELEEIEQMLADAEGDIGNIQGSLGGQEAGGGLALVEMRALRTKLEADLAALPLRPDEAPAALVVVEERKEASMQAVAQQLVPQMNEVQRQHDESEAKLQGEIDAVQAKIDDAERATELARLEGQRDEQQRLHDLALEQLEAKASAALRSLEEQHTEEVARIQHDAAHAAGEQERLKARLAQLVPQIERATGADGGGGERRGGAAPDGAPDLAAARAGSKDASEWVAERLAFMLLEDSKNRQRSAMRRWQAMAEFKEGLELGAGVGGKSAAEAEALIAPLKLGMAAATNAENRALAKAKTDKVKMLQQADAQAAQLEQASMALAVKTALDAGSQSAVAADAAARAMAEAAAEEASSMARQTAEFAAAGAARAAAQVHELQRDLAETQERLRREQQEKESVLEHMQEAQQAAQRLALQAADRAAEHTARKMDDENWQRERRLRGELSAAEELARSRGEVASEAKLKEEAARRAASTEAATAREAANEAAAFAAKYQQAVEALQLEMGRGDEARRAELAARKEAVGAGDGPIAAAVTREQAEALLGAAAGLADAGEADLDGGDQQASGQLSARRTELEAALAAKQADLDEARRVSSGAELRLGQLKQAGQAGVTRINAQRELDEASAKASEAQAELAELAGRLAEMQPALARQRLSREMLRAQAESLLPQLAAANVGSLPLARSLIELMQERMQTLQGAAADAGRAVSRDQAEAGRAEAAVMRAELQAKGREVELYREELRGARQQLEMITAAPAGSKTEQLVQQAQSDEAARLREALADAVVARSEAERLVAAARTEAESGGGSVVGSVFGGGGDSERLASELSELQARLDERSAELNLAQAEKTRLQRAVTDLKAGKVDAVYEQARQDAEKAVLDRMMASGFSFEQGR